MEEEEAVGQTAPTGILLLPLVPSEAPRMEMSFPNSMGTGCYCSCWCRSPFPSTGRRRMWRCPDLPLGRDVQHRIRLLSPSEGEELLALLPTSTEEEELLLLLLCLAKAPLLESIQRSSKNPSCEFLTIDQLARTDTSVVEIAPASSSLGKLHSVSGSSLASSGR